MNRLVLICLPVLPCLVSTVRGEGVPEPYQPAIRKGLQWLARQQARDGHWEAPGGQFPTALTALAGMAFLMEGSTLREGKYAENIRRAVDWLMDRAQRNGLLGNPSNPTEARNYMHGHGYALLFLACVYGEEEDGDRRKKLEEILNRAVEFTGKAQTVNGGWGYLTSLDGGGFDEGSVTATQLQGLRAARNAGIVVPRSIIDKAYDYLKRCTTPRGGVIYSLSWGRGSGGERRPLTAAAIACSFSAGEYDSELARRWIKFCQANIPAATSRNMEHFEYTHYYYAQVLYFLGEEGYQRLFPESRSQEQLTWSKYRRTLFDFLIGCQAEDGAWVGDHIGPVYATSVYLCILQLEKAILPIYQR